VCCASLAGRRFVLSSTAPVGNCLTHDTDPFAGSVFGKLLVANKQPDPFRIFRQGLVLFLVEIPNDVMAWIILIGTEALGHKEVNSIVDNGTGRSHCIVEFSKGQVYLSKEVIDSSPVDIADRRVYLNPLSGKFKVFLALPQDALTRYGIEVQFRLSYFLQDERYIAVLMNKSVVHVSPVEVGLSEDVIAFFFAFPFRQVDTRDHSVRIFDPVEAFGPVPAKFRSVGIVHVFRRKNLSGQVHVHASLVGRALNGYIGEYPFRNKLRRVAVVLMSCVAKAGNK